MSLVTAGCIDTDPPASRRTFGQSQKSLTGIEYAHHAMWVTFTETRCKRKQVAHGEGSTLFTV